MVFIFAVWSALIVVGWVVVAVNSLGHAEIASSVFLVLFQEGGCMVSQRLHFLFLMLIMGTRW